MIIRKLFKFENAHIVRGCSSRRCSRSIHGHSYKVELLFSGAGLDNGQMIYDFGLMKGVIKDLIDSFDHAITLWSQDDPEYIHDMKKWSERWVQIPLNPSAEQFARIFFAMVSRVLELTIMNNGEKEVKLHSVIVHETETGYAMADIDDMNDESMKEIDLNEIYFSDRVKNEWKDAQMWYNILSKNRVINPKEI